MASIIIVQTKQVDQHYGQVEQRMTLSTPINLIWQINHSLESNHSNFLLNFYPRVLKSISQSQIFLEDSNRLQSTILGGKEWNCTQFLAIIRGINGLGNAVSLESHIPIDAGNIHVGMSWKTANSTPSIGPPP